MVGERQRERNCTQSWPPKPRCRGAAGGHGSPRGRGAFQGRQPLGKMLRQNPFTERPLHTPWQPPAGETAHRQCPGQKSLPDNTVLGGRVSPAKSIIFQTLLPRDSSGFTVLPDLHFSEGQPGPGCGFLCLWCLRWYPQSLLPPGAGSQALSAQTPVTDPPVMWHQPPPPPRPAPFASPCVRPRLTLTRPPRSSERWVPGPSDNLVLIPA